MICHWRIGTLGRTEVEDTSTNGMVLDVLSIPFDSFNMIFGVVFSEISGLNLGFSTEKPSISQITLSSFRRISSSDFEWTPWWTTRPGWDDSWNSKAGRMFQTRAGGGPRLCGLWRRFTWDTGLCSWALMFFFSTNLFQWGGLNIHSFFWR